MRTIEELLDRGVDALINKHLREATAG